MYLWIFLTFNLSCFRSNLAGKSRKSILGNDCVTLGSAEAMGPVHMLYSDTGLIGNWFITSEPEEVDTLVDLSTFAMYVRWEIVAFVWL